MTGRSNKTEPVTALAARRIVRLAMTASMATIEPDGGPYVSLVSVATAVDCTPIVLLSQLSHHTANLGGDPRVSLLFDGTAGYRDRLEGGRVTVSGTLVACTGTAHQQRYRARHPNAFYASFGDFGWYRLDINRAVFVAGFGRVRKFSGKSLLLANDQCADLANAQDQLLSAFNSDSSPQEQPDAWQLAGADPEGLDFLRNGDARRHDFPKLTTDPSKVLAQIAERASAAQAGDPIVDLASNQTG